MRSDLVLDVRYKLEERIAVGGVGTVWRGKDLLLQRPVAVKLLRPEYADHPEALQRFRAEARHAGALSHPCIAQVHDYCDRGPDTAPYLVMELVDGPSLADVLVTGTVSAARALEIVAQTAAGLAAAHRTGLVHRDIKPANILLSPDGLVKITDFGIAHAAGSASVTAPQMVMGTAQYLAPERITGGPGGPASDLYSLGIVLYECLAGQPPFDGNTAEVMGCHIYRPMPPLPSGVPPAISELLGRLTVKDPATRLADAAELSAIAMRLRSALAAAPFQASLEPAGPAKSVPAEVPVRPIGTTRPILTTARPTRKRHPRLLLAAAAMVVLAGACGLLASGVLGSTATGGHSNPGSATRAHTPSAGTTPNTQPVPRTPGPSPSPSPDRAVQPQRKAHPGRSRRPGHDASPTPRTSGSTAATPSRSGTGSPSPTPSTSSTGSGGDPLPLPSLPVIGLILSL